MDAFVVDRRQPKDESQIEGLYRAVFGTALAEGSRRRWHWQYDENPETAGQDPVIWVAREADGRILGQYASMPVRLWWGETEVSSSWGMDVFVRPEARGRGVGARLFCAWADHVDVALGLGLTPSSYGLFLKLGYRDVGPVPFFEKALDPVAVARRRLGRLLGQVAGRALGLALRLRERRPRPQSAAVTQRIDGFGPEHDDLWERARASYAMCVRRDAAYLNWKYVRCPHRSYDLWEARRAEKVTGYAVTRHEDYHGLRLGWIVDLFTASDDPDSREALLDAVLAAFREARVARAQAFAMSTTLAGSLRGRAFWAGRSPMQFCVRSRWPSDTVLEDLGRWHVVFGDSDMDR
jgi:GNAT superfamily N-acetyltransferase